MESNRYRGTGWPLPFAFVALAGLILLNILVVYAIGIHATEHEEMLRSEQESISSLDSLFSSLKDAETGQRGFLLTGNEKYLGPYDAALAKLHGERESLPQMLHHKEIESNSVVKLEALIDQKLEELSRTIQIRRERGLEAVLPVVDSDYGEQTMDRIRSEVGKIRAAHQIVLEKNISGTEDALRTRNIVLTLVLLLNLGIIYWSYDRINRAAVERRRAEESLRRQAALIDLSPDAIIVRLIDGTIKFWSEGAEKLYGWTREEAIGQTTNDLFKSEFSEPLEKIVEWIKSGRNWTGEIIHTTRSGRKVTVQSFWHAEAVDSELEILESNVDVTDRKRVAEALRESEERVRRKLESVLSPEGDLGELDLTDLIDAPAMQKLMEDFYAVAHIPMSILDTVGKVLVGVGWQNICSEFHRVNPETCRFCIESDTELTDGLASGETRLYRCKNNLWDMVTPMVVAGKKVGNIFTGQFFFEDEEIDREDFRAKARKYGFDEEEYLSALDQVPRMSHDTVEKGMTFFVKLADMLSQLGYSNAKLARLLAERDRLAESVRSSEERYRKFVKASSQIVWTTNPVGEMEADVPAWQEFTGQSVEEVRGFGWMNAIRPEDREKVAEAWRKAAESRNLYEVEYVLRAQDGSWRDIHARGVPILREDGSIREWIGTCIDITEKKQAEEALRASEFRLRRFYESGLIGVIYWNMNGEITDANDKFLEMVGYSREDMRGGSIDWIHMTPPEYAALDQFAASELKATGVDTPFEKEYIRKDGTRVPILIGAAMLDEERLNGVAFVLDISDRKRLEAELRSAVISAEGAKAAAEQANAAKDQFLAVLSHELRTPLTPILAAVQLLERNPALPDLAQNHIQVIRRNLELEARLIDDLLDLTRIVRGKVALEKVAVNIQDVLENVAQVCRPDIDAGRLHFTIQIDKPFLIYADPSRLQQAFWNLVKNSIKFTGEDGCIGIRAFENRGSVTVEVSDSGIGIEQEALPKIFDAFEQGGQRVTRQFGGLGLGLAITKRLVEMHGGVISAQSGGKGKGAVFQVELPIMKQVQEEKRKERELQTAENITPARVSRRILLVEDHGDTAQMTSTLLKSLGHHVEIAGDAGEALKAAEEGRFDLLISDLGLPDKSGLDLMRELRESGINLKGIALSGYGREEDIQRSKDAGFSEHLIKPVDFDVLERTVERVAPL